MHLRMGINAFHLVLFFVLKCVNVGFYIWHPIQKRFRIKMGATVAAASGTEINFGKYVCVTQACPTFLVLRATFA